MTKFSTKIAGVAVALALFVGVALPARAAALTQTQVSAIIQLLQSFGADQSTIASVQTALGVAPSPILHQLCVDLSRNLTLGSTGSDVAALQGHLATKGYFTYTGARGYYGFITAQAVGQLQVSLGIVSSASDNAYGLMGPRTRAAIGCTTAPPNTTFSATPTSGAAPLNVTFSIEASGWPSQYTVDFGDGQRQILTEGNIAGCIAMVGQHCPNFITYHTYTSAGTYMAKLRSNGGPAAGACNGLAKPDCDVIGTATITVTNSSSVGAPSISGIDGPTQLAVGQSGTWNVRVNDSSGYLSYSVRWGDEVQTSSGYGTASSASVASSGTFTHTYAIVGTYSPTFTVTNRNGQSVSAGASVVVGGSAQTSVLTATPTSGSAPLAVNFNATGLSNSQYVIEYGDGQNSGPLNAECLMANQIGCTGNSYVLGNKLIHTYTSAGTYTAKLQLYVACLYTNSITRCMAPAQVLGSVTITVW